jgi:ABC-2 type transport system permease protein
MKSGIAFGNIFMKDMRNYYLKPPNISWGIIFPLAWTLMFFLKTPGNVNIEAVLPGVIAMSILFGTTSMLSVTITFERSSRSFERLLLAPIELSQLMLAKTSGAIVFGIINAFVPIIMAGFLMDLSPINWGTMLLGIVLIAITSTFLGLFISVSANQVFEAQTFSNFFRFPMVFLCGLFIPVGDLPLILQPLSYIAPLTYGVDVLKFAITGHNFILTPLLNILVLAGFTIFLFAISIRNIKVKWIY